MKKLITILATMLLLTSCGPIEPTQIGTSNTIDTTIGTSNTINTTIGTSKERKNEIMLINQYTNYAWEYQNYGYFVTIYGDVYEFDFSNDYQENMYMFPNEKTDFLSSLVDIMDNSEVSKVEDVSNISNFLLQVDANAGWKNTFYACDMGQTTLYGVRPNADNSDMEIIKLYSYGDTIEVSQDVNTQEICSMWLKDEYIIE